MNDDGARRRLLLSVGGGLRVGVLCGAIFEVEALRQLEIELDGGALERALEGISDGDVNLGSVERSVAGVDLPLSRVLLIECLGELLNE